MPEDDALLSAFDGRDLALVCARERGGPYDQESLVAGILVGQIDGLLHLARSVPAGSAMFGGWRTPTSLLEQVDLVAMRHGFTMKVQRVVGAVASLVFMRDAAP